MKVFANLTKKRDVVRRRPTPRTTRLPAAVPEARTAEIREILHGPRLQTKLTIGAPDDAYEREADRVADAVMRMPEPEAIAENAWPVPDERIQRVDEECEEEVRRQPAEDTEEEESLQAKELPGRVREVSRGLETGILALRSGGRPLPESARSFFEPRFGKDLSSVKVHTGRVAAELAGAIHARAFTVGTDIIFGSRRYAPETTRGRELLAHELTHVIQQGGRRVDQARRQPSTSQDAAKSPRFRLETGDWWFPYRGPAKNDTADYVVAGVSTKEGGQETFNTELVAPGAEYRARKKWSLDCFIRIDGTAVKFRGIAGNVDWPELDRLQTLMEFGQYMGGAKRLFSEVFGEEVVKQALEYAQTLGSAQAAGYPVTKPKCYVAARSIVESAHKALFGKDLTADLAAPRKRDFNRLWGSKFDKNIWMTIDDVYRGKGAAGAMAFAGKGELIEGEDIWSGALKPGAVMQAWKEASDAKRVQEGEPPQSHGHSFIFIEYIRESDGSGNAITGMIIVDQHGKRELFKKSDDYWKSYEYWVGANLISSQHAAKPPPPP